MRYHSEPDTRETLPHVVRTVIDIAAPPPEVFEALTEPRELAEWWRGEATRTVDCESDPRPGGAWRVRTVGPDGAERSVGGEYQVVDPPHRLDQSWQADDDARPSHVRYDLEPCEIDGAEGTRLTVTHTSTTAMALGASAAVSVQHAFGPARCATHARPAWALRTHAVARW